MLTDYAIQKQPTPGQRNHSQSFNQSAIQNIPVQLFNQTVQNQPRSQSNQQLPLDLLNRIGGRPAPKNTGSPMPNTSPMGIMSNLVGPSIKRTAQMSPHSLMRQE